MRPPAFAPMLASSGGLPGSEGWVVEPKWDGCRAMVTVHEGAVTMRSRNGHDVTDCYPDLTRPPEVLAGTSAVFDGEIVALGSNGLPDFQLLQQRMNRRRPTAALRRAVPLVLVVFDVLWLDGVDLTAQALSDRRVALERFRFAGSWQLTPRLDVELTDELIDSFRGAGLEGVVVKNSSSPYRAGSRSPQWIKVKARQQSWAVIGGFLAEPTRTSIGSLAVGMHGPGGFHYVGQLGNSLPRDPAEQLDRFLRSTVCDRSPFCDLDSDALVHVEPHVVVEVAFTEVTAAGTFRQPILKRIVLDARADDVTLSAGFGDKIAARTFVRVGGGQRL